MLILVLESSTTSAKAMLFCPKNGVLRMETKTYAFIDNDNGVQDAESIFKQTIELGREVSEGQNIDIIALCGAWHSVMVCDRRMTPVTPAYSWTYTGAAELAGELRKDKAYTNSFYQRTGCMVHAIYPAFKLLHLKEEGVKLDGRYILGQGSYNFYQLTGERLVSDCMASGSGLLNIALKQYDREILSRIGLEEEQLGRIVTYRDVRPLSKEGARLLGVKSGIPVIPANADGGLNQVGAGALKDGVMTFSVGTSGALRLTTRKPVLPAEPSTWCYLSPYSFMSGAATSGACNCVDWVKEKMFSPSISYAAIESEDVNLKSLPVFLPFLYGERCPDWQDDRRAGFYDVHPSHTATDLYFSVLEGVLFNLYQCFEVLCQTNQKPEKIQLSGGIVNSKVWTQMCCDIFQQEMECSTLEQTSLLGGAVLAMELSGAIGSILDYTAAKGAVIRPNEKMKEVYQDKYRRYQFWYQKTRL